MAKGPGDLYPESMRDLIEDVVIDISRLNFGVYKIANAQDQEEYDLFATEFETRLSSLEKQLSDGRRFFTRFFFTSRWST